jgi:hypothetical protein
MGKKEDVKSVTVEDLAKVVGGLAALEDPGLGKYDETKGPQRESRSPVVDE